MATLVSSAASLGSPQAGSVPGRPVGGWQGPQSRSPLEGPWASAVASAPVPSPLRLLPFPPSCSSLHKGTKASAPPSAQRGHRGGVRGQQTLYDLLGKVWSRGAGRSGRAPAPTAPTPGPPPGAPLPASEASSRFYPEKAGIRHRRRLRHTAGRFGSHARRSERPGHHLSPHRERREERLFSLWREPPASASEPACAPGFC